MKKCVTCGELKHEDDYYWRHKLRRVKWNTCIECQRKQKNRWYQNNKEEHRARTKENKKIARKIAKDYLWNYLLSHPCIECGESNPNVLEFDHVRGTKRYAISDLARNAASVERLQKEMKKCVVRCANCHRIKTAKERGWYRE